MKKNITYIFIIILIYFGFRYITSYKSSPQIIKIDDIHLKIPNMHIYAIFGGIEAESKTPLDLIFEKNPYEINYPETEMVNIMFIDATNGATVSLIPTLTKQSLYTYSESNKTKKFKNCIFSIDNKIVHNYISVYVVDEVNNKGYAVSSEDNLTNMSIIQQLCDVNKTL